MRFIRVRAISTASRSATAPPESPVPAPRATNGMRQEMKQPHDLSNLTGVGRHHDHTRIGLPGRKAIHRIRGQLRAAVAHPSRAHDPAERDEKVGRHASVARLEGVPPLPLVWARRWTSSAFSAALVSNGRSSRSDSTRRAVERSISRRCLIERSHSAPAAAKKERLDRVGRQLRLLRLEIVEIPAKLLVLDKNRPESGRAIFSRERIGIVVESLDGCCEIGLRAWDETLNHKPETTEDDDVRSSVRQLLVDSNLRDATDGPRLRRLTRAPHRDDAKSPIAGQTVRQHAAIAGLENVEGKGRAGEKNHGDWEYWQLGEHDRKIKQSALLASSEKGRLANWY